ncbi:MAG: ABC transporter substrate-binding protein [Paraburkholderia fungorum]|uniref:ABC transporter substrate-binding protein n=1 Tax=Paraburkholderia agricolaris TaxID=2152888 RepID=UPI001291D5F1|nr:ABC transporter substrate-binding protein [Paraburkholderia agricolaris]MDE1008013.1 ABC transporter substrate-binding protein [Paraburkholderia fungorum]
MTTRRGFLGALTVPLMMPVAGALTFTPATAHASTHAVAGFANGPRVATPDRPGTETLLALDVKPVAAGALDVYATMGGFPPLPDGIVDCGYPAEPNLEVLRELKTSLIVIETMSASLRGLLERIAPVFVLDIYSGAGHANIVERSSAEMMRLARVIGREREGAAYIAQLGAHFAELKTKLGGDSVEVAKPPSRRPVFVTQLDTGGSNILIYAKNCVVSDVMQRLGFVNAWQGRTNGYGCAVVGVEQLAVAPQAELLYIDYGASTQAALNTLTESPVWSRLPMVREGRVNPIQPFDVFGSLPSARQFADHFAAALTARRSA